MNVQISQRSVLTIHWISVNDVIVNGKYCSLNKGIVNGKYCSLRGLLTGNTVH